MLWWGEGRDVGDEFLAVSIFEQLTHEVHLFSQSAVVRYHLLAVRECVLPSPHIGILDESIINRVNLNIASVLHEELCGVTLHSHDVGFSVFAVSCA